MWTQKGSLAALMNISVRGDLSQCLTKVVTIVGNSGEGKSHALNNTFMGGQQVFSWVIAKIARG